MSLPFPAGRQEDLLPKSDTPTSCLNQCPSWSTNGNNPCRNAPQLPEKQGAHIVCDYSSKNYYYQPDNVQDLVHTYYDLKRKEGGYN